MAVAIIGFVVSLLILGGVVGLAILWTRPTQLAPLAADVTTSKIPPQRKGAVLRHMETHE